MIWRENIHCTHQKLLKSITTILFFHSKRNWDLNHQKIIEVGKKFSEWNSISLPLTKTFKASSQNQKWKKKSELFRLLLNSLISHQQIRIFLKTPMTVCSGIICKVHLHPQSDITRVQENFLCFVLRSHITEKCTNMRPCCMCWYSQVTSKD